MRILDYTITTAALLVVNVCTPWLVKPVVQRKADAHSGEADFIAIIYLLAGLVVFCGTIFRYSRGRPWIILLLVAGSFLCWGWYLTGVQCQECSHF